MYTTRTLTTKYGFPISYQMTLTSVRTMKLVTIMTLLIYFASCLNVVIEGFVENLTPFLRLLCFDFHLSIEFHRRNS